MLIRPISKKLLIHTVIHRKKLLEDQWGNGEFSEKPLFNVRVVPAKSVEKSKNNTWIGMKSVLYIDKVHSTAPDHLEADDEIIFEGETYRVKSVARRFGFNNVVHHYEAGLV